MDQIIDLTVAGMTCASCVTRVERGLARVPGVQRASVNLATGRARVWAGAGVRRAALAEAVSQAGYSVTAKPHAARREMWELVATAALALPLILLPLPGVVQLVLAILLQIGAGARFYAGSWAALRGGSANMDVLVALGSTSAFALSAYDYFAGGALYFESAAAILLFVRLGKVLEGRAKHEAAASVGALQALRPETARRADGTAVAVAALVVGDEIELRPGERVPVDGEILAGESNLDESPVTGEALPVARGPGAHLLAGTLNVTGVLRLRVTSPPGASFLDRMASLIEDAQASKPAVQRLADRVAAVFVPVVLVLAALTFAAWALHGLPPGTALLRAVSVTIIACPCALGLATPAAILTGTGAAAKRGILFRDAAALETAAKVSLVVFDKTGTLTTGQPRLREVRALAGDAAAARRIAAALAATDTHPLSAALRQPGVVPATALQVLPGQGMSGTLDGARYSLIAWAEAPADDATWSCLHGPDGTALAAFAFTDTPRDGAAEAVAGLQAMGVRTALLSGDRAAAVQALAHAVGITEVISHASPAQKRDAIESWRAQGLHVAMLGDGINDAGALATADLGLAMGSGSDVALNAAAVTLLRPDPRLAVTTLKLARQTWRILIEGLAWAMAYNLAAIPAAALGWLSPGLAAAAMAASSVCVLANALRLRNWRER